MDEFSNSMAWLARRDGSVVLGHGPFQESAAAPTAGIAFYVQNFALNQPKPWKTPHHCETLSRAELAARFDFPTPLDGQWDSLDAAPFSIIFQEIMAAIHAGVFEKTVPVVTEHGLAKQPPARAILAAMTRQDAPLQSYGWVQRDRGFAGATPELLFAQNDTRLETMALAGTARSEDREVFAVDEKEIREHEYVAQTLVAKLLHLGRVERLAREILDLGPIVHFLTTIGLEMRHPQLAEKLLKLLHPTPALGPLPRTDETLGCLFDWRQRLACPAEFGAPFGLWENGRFEAVVAIRGIWWDQRNLRLPAGCGVIEASRLVNEWRELRLKREAVKRFLCLP